jgi:hypothetical protein
MPRLSAWFVRAALIYLALGFTLGMLLLANKGIQISPYIWQLLPAHIEFLLIGWTVQLALGVAFWILPRWQTQRGNVRPAWVAFFLLNMGIWCVVLTPWLNLPAWVLSLGRVCEAAAAGAFALHAWPRVKPWVESTT